MPRLTKDQIAARILELVSHPSLKAPKRIEDRLVGMGYGVVCGRCLGSGRYSYNQIDGDTCYGCSGAGKVAPKVSKDLLETLEADVANGATERYAAECLRKANVRRSALAVEKRVDAAEEACAWRLDFNANLEAKGEGHAWLSHYIYAWIRRVQKVVLRLSWDAQGARDRDVRENAIATLARNADAYVQALEAIDGAWVACCRSGEIAADDAAYRVWKGAKGTYQQELVLLAKASKRAQDIVLEALAGMPADIIDALQAQGDE